MLKVVICPNERLASLYIGENNSIVGASIYMPYNGSNNCRIIGTITSNYSKDVKNRLNEIELKIIDNTLDITTTCDINKYILS